MEFGRDWPERSGTYIFRLGYPELEVIRWVFLDPDRGPCVNVIVGERQMPLFAPPWEWTGPLEEDIPNGI